jgi:D-proline reductase (dithiol) PrdB
MNNILDFSWKNRLLARVYTAFPALAAAWGRRLAADSGVVPWSPVGVPLASARVALVTTGGVHHRNQPPFDMTDHNGDPSLREVHLPVHREDLVITHDYYDHRDAERDLNLVFPVERLAEIAASGAIGSLHAVAYCLMGHIDGPHLTTLVTVTAPAIARQLRTAAVDYVLLVPA